MSNRIYLIVTLLFATGLLVLFLADKSSNDTPTIHFNEKCVIQEYDNDKECTFETCIRNTGKAPLTIDKIRSSCSCSGLEEVVNGKYMLSPSYSIDPGNEKKFVARFLVKTLPEIGFNHTIYFLTNDPNYPEAKITFSIKQINYGCFAVPGAISNDHALYGSNVVSNVILFFDKNTINSKISYGSNDANVLSIKELDVDKADRQFGEVARYEITFNCKKLGQLVGSIDFKLGGNKIISVPYRINSVDEHIVNPSSILINTNLSYGDNQYYFTVREYNNNEITIRNIDLPSYARCYHEEKNGNRIKLRVVYDDLHAAMQMHTDKDVVKISICKAKDPTRTVRIISVPILLLKEE